jgi:hypothetical protein
MIPKPMKDHTDVQIFRPISLLNTLSKILERVVKQRIEDWLLKNKILSKLQCGFRRFCQTRDQILRLLQEGLAAFNRNQKLGAVFVDIEKAFDKVWHNGLLYKLNKLSIPNVLGKWLKNYLFNRRFLVKVGALFSQEELILNGVPQGSVLGPILFNIFFNDITETGTPIELALFADDIAAWTTSNLTSFITLRLQKFLDSLHNWMFKWRLKISTNKTVNCVFNKACLQYDEEVSLTYNGQKINFERNPKFLGTVLDPGLRLHKHIDFLKSRSLKRLNLLRSIGGRKWGASPRLKLITYKTLIRSMLDYVPFAPLTISDTNKQKLEKIQLKALKYSFNLGPNSTSKKVYELAKIDTTLERAKQMTTKYLNKAMRTNILVQELVSTFNQHEKLDEGALCKTVPRRTILGVLKNEKLF